PQERQAQKSPDERGSFVVRMACAAHIYGTQGRTRTGTACASTTSRERVYQFHHLGLVKPYSSDSGTAGISLVAAGAVSSTGGTSDCGICGTSNGTGTPSAAIDVLFFAMIAKPKLVQKKTVARIAVARVKKLLPPWLPNTVCE